MVCTKTMVHRPGGIPTHVDKEYLEGKKDAPSGSKPAADATTEK